MGPPKRISKHAGTDILAHEIMQCLINSFIIPENKARLKEAWDSSAPFADLVERNFVLQEFLFRPVGAIKNG